MLRWRPGWWHLRHWSRFPLPSLGCCAHNRASSVRASLGTTRTAGGSNLALPGSHASRHMGRGRCAQARTGAEDGVTAPSWLTRARAGRGLRALDRARGSWPPTLAGLARDRCSRRRRRPSRPHARRGLRPRAVEGPSPQAGGPRARLRS
jgi:hypothetical protein